MAGLTFIGDTNATTAASGQVAAGGALPAGTVEGDLVFAPVAYKRATQTVATPSGWDATTHRTVGTGAAGDGAGQIKIVAFWRTVPASFTNPSIDPGGTGAVRTAGFVVWRPDTGWTVEVSDSFGSDTTSDTAFNATGGTVLPFVTDDWVMAVLALTQNIAAPGIDVEGSTLGGASGATFNTFDSKWISGSNTGDNLRSQTATARCTAGTATTAPSVSPTLGAASSGGAVFYRIHPVHLPWHILGIDGTGGGNHFKLQYAPDGGGAVLEKSRAEIVAGHYESPYFFPVGNDQEWCRFQVRLDSATTGGTSYPRSELREMATDGTTNAAWSTSTNTHRLKATIRVPTLAFDKPTIIFGQIHDGSDDLLQLCTELNATSGLVEGKLRINGTSSGRPNMDLDFRANEEHTYLVDVTSGTTRIYWDDLNNPIHQTTDIASTTAYYKAGCYPNTNETTDPPGTDYAVVDVKDLNLWHTGFAGSELLLGGPALADSLFLAA